MQLTVSVGLQRIGKQLVGYNFLAPQIVTETEYLRIVPRSALQKIYAAGMRPWTKTQYENVALVLACASLFDQA